MRIETSIGSQATKNAVSLCFISIQEQEPVSGASKISHVHPRTIFCAGMHIGRNAWASEGRQLDGEGCRTVHVFIRSLIFLCLFFHSGSSSCPLIFDLLRPVQLLDPVLSTCSCSTGTEKLVHDRFNLTQSNQIKGSATWFQVIFLLPHIWPLYQLP